MFFSVEYAVDWLKVLVQTHSSQLMALGSEDLLNKFGPCIGIIEHRVNCLKELSKFVYFILLIVNILELLQLIIIILSQSRWTSRFVD